MSDTSQFANPAVAVLPGDAPSLASAPTAHWFAVYTTPRHEKAVLRQCESRLIQSFLPLYTTIHRWRNGCQARIEQPLFPGYVFVCVERRECMRVLRIPGVLSLVGPGREPAPLPSSDIEALRSGLLQRRFEPHSYLVVGEKVRIHSGALAGMVGVLLRKKNSLRVVLTLDLIMQSVAVEVGSDEVEPLRPHWH